MRLLILLGLIYLCYRALKSWMIQSGLSQQTVSGKTTQQIDDEMIKDPVCDMYFPQKDGVHLRSEGEDYYFCSTACRDKFLNLHSKSKPGTGGPIR
jgi:uncharacterized protein